MTLDAATNPVPKLVSTGRVWELRRLIATIILQCILVHVYQAKQRARSIALTHKLSREEMCSHDCCTFIPGRIGGSEDT